MEGWLDIGLMIRIRVVLIRRSGRDEEITLQWLMD